MITDFVHAADEPILHRLYNSTRSRFWIAGGAPLNWYQRIPVDSDIDLYFKSEDDFNTLDTALTNAWESTSDEATEPAGYFTLFSTPVKKKPKLFHGDVLISHKHVTNNAITYTVTIVDKDGHATDHPEWKIQLIKRKYYNTVVDVIDDFDITVCQIAMGISDRPIVGNRFAEDVAAKRLVFNKITPGSAKRLIKYWTYGYTPSDETLQSIIDNPELDLKLSEDDY